MMFPGAMPDYMGWMMLGSYLFSAVLIAVALYIGVRVARSPESRTSARSILEERLARGEIDAEEFRSRLAILQG